MKPISKNQDKYRLVPIAMCIHVIQNNLESPFRLFILLKLAYSGKFKKCIKEIDYLALELGVTTKTIKAQIKRLEKLQWIRINRKTRYYIILSFEGLRDSNEWESRASIEVYFKDIFRIRAITGAAIYGYLHKDFWRKVKRERVVQIKGCTYHALSSSFNKFNGPAPISVLGVKKLFRIPQSKASRIKSLAFKEGLINVKKQHYLYDIDKEHALYLKKYEPERTRNLIYKKGKYHFQQIDHVEPLFSIRKRKKLET